MPFYRYESFSREGKSVTGTLDASSIQNAKTILKGQGLMPVKIIEIQTESKFFNLFEKGIDLKTKIIFTKQLAVLLKSGVPLVQSLNLLNEQFEGKLKRILINIKDGVKSGESFASQLSKYPKIFSNIYVQLVKAGEASGNLHIILDRLTEYLQRSEETRRSIRKAISYPIFMLSFSFSVIIALLTFLVPRITDLFIKMHKELPAPTEFLKNVSDFLLQNYLTFSFVIFAVILFFVYWKSTPYGKLKLDELFIKLPLISYFFRTKAVVQFSKTLGMLLEAGVNLSDALDIVCKIVDNKVLVSKLQIAKNKIIKEGKIARYLKETGIFPNIASYMISTGEQSGNLDKMLLSVGYDYDVELEEFTDSLVSKIGPIMTIITGIIIAFIVLSVFLPVVEMGNIPGF